MRFLYGKVKASVGHTVKVEFSKPTRVLIMTDREFVRYKNNLTFTYYGGHKESPYEFTVPKSGTWYVVVEKGTYYEPEKIKASISITRAEPPHVKERETTEEVPVPSEDGADNE